MLIILTLCCGLKFCQVLVLSICCSKQHKIVQRYTKLTHCIIRRAKRDMPRIYLSFLSFVLSLASLYIIGLTMQSMLARWESVIDCFRLISLLVSSYPLRVVVRLINSSCQKLYNISTTLYDSLHARWRLAKSSGNIANNLFCQLIPWSKMDS